MRDPKEKCSPRKAQANFIIKTGENTLLKGFQVAFGIDTQVTGDSGAVSFADLPPGTTRILRALPPDNQTDAWENFSPSPRTLKYRNNSEILTIKPVLNKVAPDIKLSDLVNPEEKTIWFESPEPEKEEDKVKPVKITLSLRQTNSQNPFKGKCEGTLKIPDGYADIYRDENCVVEFSPDEKIDLEIPETKDLYLKGKKKGESIPLGFELDDLSENPVNISFEKITTETLKFEPVNVIKPIIEPEETAAVLLNNDKALKGKPTSLSEITVKLEQTNGSHEYAGDDLKARLVCEPEIARCVKNEAGDLRASSNEFTYSELTAEPPPKAHVQGLDAGECKLKLELDVPKDLKKSFRIAEKEVECSLIVVKLELEVRKYEGATSYVDADKNMDPDDKAEGRLIHYQRRDKSGLIVHNRAKVTVKEPKSLWEHDEEARINLKSETDGTGELRFYDAETGGEEARHLSKDDFNDADKDLWIEVSDNAGGTAKVQGLKNASLKDSIPEKEAEVFDVHVGATVKGKDLEHGDCLKLNAYSFDGHLEHATEYECRLHMDRAGNDKLLYRDATIACAGFHGTYDDFKTTPLSGFHVDKDWRYSTLSSFSLFLEALDTGGSKAEKARDAVDFITKHLNSVNGPHKIPLHKVTKTMIKNYIENTLDLNAAVEYDKSYHGGYSNGYDDKTAGSSGYARGYHVGYYAGYNSENKSYEHNSAAYKNGYNNGYYIGNRDFRGGGHYNDYETGYWKGYNDRCQGKDRKSPRAYTKKFGFNKMYGVPGTHAEVLAVNAALKYLELKGQNPEYAAATLQKISVAAYKPQNVGGFAKKSAACENCIGILTPPAGPGVRIIT